VAIQGLALEWYVLDSDFADALHPSLSYSAVELSFDKFFFRAEKEACITLPKELWLGRKDSSQVLSTH